MVRARQALVTIGLPALYLLLVVIFTLPEKPEYWLKDRTVMTVSEKAGPAILHMPDPIYPAQALHDAVEGNVTVKVVVDAEGAVTSASAIAGPEALREAAVDAVRRWQFEGKAQATQVEVGFSPLYATQSLTPAEPVERTLPSNLGNVRGKVRVVALVDAQGKASNVQAVAGPEELRGAAVESVRRWVFRPARRNGSAVTATTVVDVAFGT